MIKRKILLLILSIALIAIIVSAIPQTKNIQGQLLNLNNTVLNGTFNMTAKIYNVSTGGTALLEQNFTEIIIDTNGIYNLTIDTTTIDFTENYYFGLTINNDTEFTRIPFTTSPYADIADSLEQARTYNVTNITITAYLCIDSVCINNFSMVNQTFTDTTWNISGSDYIYNESGILDVNETILNATIDARAGGDITAVNTADIYIYNGSASGAVSLLFNETKLNETIDARDTDTNTWWSIDLTDFINNSNTLELNWTTINNTIDSRTVSTTYLPYIITNVSGILDDGNITSILTPEDNDTYNISEESGANPITIVINFTNVTTFDSIIGRVRYDGGLGHEIQLEILRVDTGLWENYLDLTDTTDFVNIYVPVFDPQNHVNNTNVSIRFFHVQSGVPTHDFFIDYLAIVDGFTALTVADHDALSGRDDISNHPQYLTINGSLRNMTDNFNVGGFNIFNLDTIFALNWSNVSITESQITDLNHTNNTWWSLQGIYLYNNSNNLTLNESKLNATIDARSDFDTDTFWNITGSLYIYNNSGILDVNETKLNATIAVLDTDTNTWWTLTGYMINDSDNLNINESRLNNTIDARAGADGNNYTSSISFINSSDTLNLTRNDGTSLLASFEDNDTTYTVSSPITLTTLDLGIALSGYMYNCTGSLCWNETMGNATTLAICKSLNQSWNYTVDTDTTYTADETYINMISDVVTQNETVFNTTALAICVALNDSWNYTVDTDTTIGNLSGSNAGGDLGGTYPNPTVNDNSHAHIANNITAGTFGAGNYVMPDNLTIENQRFEGNTSFRCYANATCMICVIGGTIDRVCI